MVNYLLNGKKQMLILIIRNMTSKNYQSKTIIQSRYFQFTERPLNTLFITNYFISFKETTSAHQINLDSSLGTHALINYWLLLMKYINHLTMHLSNRIQRVVLNGTFFSWTNFLLMILFYYLLFMVQMQQLMT